jgi:tRNA-dihydrouridine synthase
VASATPPLKIGPIAVDPPVVLAPMAGITNVAYRQVCREFGSPTALYVCEMITARAVVERDVKTMEMIQFGKDEYPRSLQLYSVDPKMMSEAVKFLVGENLVDHLDGNFGCPKSTHWQY